MKLIAATCTVQCTRLSHLTTTSSSTPVRQTSLCCISWEKINASQFDQDTVCLSFCEPILCHFWVELSTSPTATLNVGIKYRQVGGQVEDPFNWRYCEDHIKFLLHSIMVLQYKFGGQSSATVDFRLYHSAIQGWKTTFRNVRVSHRAVRV